MGSTSRLSLFMLGTVVVGSVSGTALSAGPQKDTKSAAGAKVDYARDVRPVLAAHCVRCHGPENQQGGLRLDLPAELARDGKTGPLFVSGKSAESELIRRVTSRDPSKIMPLGAPPLSAKQIAALRAWIDAGAPLPAAGASSSTPEAQRPTPPKPHWSFVPPRRPAVPRVKNAAWVRNPVDAFVLAALEKKGLQPSPPADPATLIRRVTLDLTGLPPTPEEVQAFVNECESERRFGLGLRLGLGKAAPSHKADPTSPSTSGARLGSNPKANPRTRGSDPNPNPNLNPNLPGSPDRREARPEGAYERLVKRLLASPRYGERWAQHWLDVVRFAETHGFEGDGDRPQAWRYRDYVVRSLNADKPYDRFLQEQIAGDEIDPNSFELRVATGFLRAGPQHVVGGNVDLVEQRQEWLTEAVAGVGSAVMGVTIGCARCHDHKFDPIPQKDFYRLQAFFAGTSNQSFQPANPTAEKAHREGMQALQQRMRPIQAEIAALEKPYREELRRRKLEALEAPYRQALDTPEKDRTAAQKRLAAEAGVMLKIAWDEVVEALSPADRERRAGLRRRLHALELEAPEPVPMAPGVAENLSPVPPVHVLIRGDVHARGPVVEAGFPTALPAALEAAVQPAAAPAAGPGRRTRLAQWLTRPDHPLTGRVLVNRVWQHHFGRGLVGTPNDFGRHGERPSHPELLDYLASVFTMAPTSNMAQGSKGAEGQRGEGTPVNTAASGDGRLPFPGTRESGCGEPGIRTDGGERGFPGAASKPRGSHFALRTSPFALNPGASALTLTPTLTLTPAPHSPRSSSTLGASTIPRASGSATSTLPHSHTPTLGMSWSLKQLHYLLVTSSAYRQSSTIDARKAKLDPDNRLLWRMNRRRLDAEAIRDSALQAAGTLNEQVGGPAVRVPLEPEVYAQIFTEGEPDNLWPVTPDPRQHLRRSLYLLRKRNVRLPMLAVFDAPDMMSSCGARGQSVHALQALTLLNSEFMGAQSRALARRVLQEVPTDSRRRIRHLYLLTLGRSPQPRELAATERFLAGQVALVRERLARGETVARLEDLPGRDPAEVAAWIDLSLAALNLNEFVYVK